jgi:SAM-dependent methyltransferase
VAYFFELLDEAQRHPTQGWDFAWLANRITTDALPWDFATIVTGLARTSPDLLDLGTGGGEWLARLSLRPARTVATEAWPPNVVVARRRLEPLGVEVRDVAAVADNNDQYDDEVNVPLPFDDGEFHLVSSRHESFHAGDVARVLSRGGHFATQQVGDGLFREFRALFDAPQSTLPALTLEMLCAQVTRSGLTVIESGEALQTVSFADVGALAWYLRMIPWTVPDFDVAAQRDALERIHGDIERSGPLRVAQPGLYLVARKV